MLFRSHKEPNPVGSSEAENRNVSDSTVKVPTAIHVHIDLETVERFAKGYLEDKDFALVLRRNKKKGFKTRSIVLTVWQKMG